MLLIKLLQLQPELMAPVDAFSWSQLLVALVVGLLTAFALQLLLTNLGLAIAISMVPVVADASTALATDEVPEENPDNRIALGTMAGFGILLTTNTVLFAACFLAVKLIQANNPISGASTGIVIWSAYLLLLIWLSSKALNSVIAPVLDIAVGGFRRLISAIAAIGKVEDKPVTEAQITAIIQREIQACLTPIKQEIIEEQMRLLLPVSLPNSSRQFAALAASSQPSTPAKLELWLQVESYLRHTSSKKLTPKRINRKLSKILQTYLASAHNLRATECDRAALTQLLEHRQDLSSKQRKRIMRQIDETWSIALQFAPQAEAVSEIDQSSLLEQLNLLQGSLHSTVKQILSRLPEHLQQLDLTRSQGLAIASLILPMVAEYLEAEPVTDVDTLELETADSEALAELDELEQDESSLTQLSQSLGNQAKNLQHHLSEQITSIQQGAQDQIDALKQQTHARIEATRQAAATAAWWLFFIATTSALSAATAGIVATGVNPLQLMGMK